MTAPATHARSPSRSGSEQRLLGTQVTGVKENERGKIKQLVFNRTEQDDDGNWMVLDDEVGYE